MPEALPLEQSVGILQALLKSPGQYSQSYFAKPNLGTCLMVFDFENVENLGQPAMLDVDMAKRWSSDPLFLGQSRRWVWCRTALPSVLLTSLTAAGLPSGVQVDLQALANAFWPWVAGLEHDGGYEKLDSVDFGHFAAGLLLYHLLVSRPLPLSVAQRSEEVFTSTRTVLTLLTAWRAALGAPTLQLETKDRLSASWAGYVENVAQDPCIAIPFLDTFTGVEPAWQYPLVIGERPAMRRAMEARRTDASGPS